ncbi:MMPL family transporter [Frigoriglobus tundricola]|uniref:Membrane transport protein MMPL domain-containing protein n=1 Tax=Frigoriglobus tundricola TaxID=2774151 RepID=A0A6M5YTL3_9BACT|nr:MMPL family transporter [Frigoriglobus tundricola]QJW97437.1 hypothetical protein FTUN_5011 [Frigoriglobus tundricola]
MFRLLGRLVEQAWPAFLLLWAVLFVALWFGAPAWEQVGKTGQFIYLPADAPSNRATATFDEAFPGQRAGSGIVLVVTRADGQELRPEDRAFVSGTLAPELRHALVPGGTSGPNPPVVRVRAPDDGPTGALLKSPDQRAELVAVELKADFLDARNWPTVAAVEQLLNDLRVRGAVPTGLDVALTGSAVLGRDTGRAEAQSAGTVLRWTVAVVVGLLLIVYRAPLLAVIPLLSVSVAIEVALRLLGLASERADLGLNQGTRLYVTVVGYGAGVDYCLFLIARSKEQWGSGAGPAGGVRDAVAKVGPAIAASAATVAIGVAMMGTAEFGKIRQAGLGIAFSLAVVLSAALTLAPALLCLTGRFALWPRHVRAPQCASPGERFWGHVGRVLARRPGTIGGAAVALMLPFALLGAARADAVSYDLTRNVPIGAPSAEGIRVLREHFPAGTTAPVTAVLRNDGIDFRTPAGTAAVGALIDGLRARAGELGLADVRGVTEPLGTGPEGRAALARIGSVGAGVVHDQAVQYYVGSGGHVTRVDLVPTADPFSGPGVLALDKLESALQAELPATLRTGTEVRMAGPAAGLRDLQAVTDRDRRRIDALVVAAVFVVLLVLLRRPGLSAYLILTVVFSYFTTLGLTHLVFEAIGPRPFPGPDWKVPLFLFTILVAVGEDYNIFLLTRVREEEERHGAAGAATVALEKTGGVITTCGLVMAGTFTTLLTGSLSELWQMGFALSCGVLLDTLIVRPVLVPAFLLLGARWRPRGVVRSEPHVTVG